MLLLSNLSYLENYWSEEFMKFLIESTIKRMKNEMKMDFYQSRWTAVNVTALARLFIAK